MWVEEILVKKKCDACGTNLVAGEIPVEKRCNDSCGDTWTERTEECKESHCYGKTSTHFYRSICVEIPGVYDGGLFNECPDCHHRWHRWPEGHYLRKRAEVYVEKGLNDEDPMGIWP